MPTDQHWPSVWPAARTFHPAVVPLPLHMGYIERKNRYAPPSKWANAELMKIPNFLHLSPPAVKAHCQAIKKFCTKWPEALETDKDCERNFPIEVMFTDFVHASPSIRDPRSRLVKMTFKINSLPMDHHARDKFKRLLQCQEADPVSGHRTQVRGLIPFTVLRRIKRYDEKTDIATLTADRCPMRTQNYDFLHYILTAAFFESWKTEAWEKTVSQGGEKTQQDWEHFIWRESESFKRVVKYLKNASIDSDHNVETMWSQSENLKEEIDKRIKKDPVVKAYEESLTQIYDSGESEESVQKYKESVVALLFPKESNSNDGTKRQRSSQSHSNNQSTQVERNAVSGNVSL